MKYTFTNNINDFKITIDTDSEEKARETLQGTVQATNLEQFEWELI